MLRVSVCFLLLLFLSGKSIASSIVNSDFAGSQQCKQCHKEQYQQWQGSHHDHAMQTATKESVLGDFNNASITVNGVTSQFFKKNNSFYVRTNGADGKLNDFQVQYTFGWYPLQQYLVQFPRGHIQTLGLAWDSRKKSEGGQRWFHLYPDNPPKAGDNLHWTSRDQTWNYQCAECHSTNLQKNYNVNKDSYKTTWSEMNVACEACHGPGVTHIAWAKNPKSHKQLEQSKGLEVRLVPHDITQWRIDKKTDKPLRSPARANRKEIEVCARCHARRGQFSDKYEYGKPLSNTHRLALLDEHLYFPDGQIKDEVYVYGSFIQSRMYHQGVTCSDCHEPHSLKLRVQGNGLCTRCHQAKKFNSTKHHKHKNDGRGSACIACHMPQRTYMVIDDRADHSLRIPRPDLSVKLGTPNACNQCHKSKTNKWAADQITKWYGKRNRNRTTHFAETIQAARTNQSNSRAKLLTLASDESQAAIVRATAVELMRLNPGQDFLASISQYINDDSELVRYAAVRFLENVNLQARVQLGLEKLEDPSRLVRLEAARVLAPLMSQTLPENLRADLTKQLDEYIRSQAVNAERPESHINIGLVDMARGDFVSAEKSYKTALRLQKNFTPAYINLADLYRVQKRDNDGENILRQGIKAVPYDASLYHSLGLLLVRKKQIKPALEYLAQAAKLDAQNPRYAYVYAIALDSNGKHKQAISILEQAQQQHPGNRDILFALVNYQMKQGDLQAVKNYSEKLKYYFPNDPQVQNLWKQLPP